MIREGRTREGGFTLIELLIAMAVSGIVMVAAATGFISVVRGSKDLHDRFLQSHDAQLLATYFPSDVQSADPNLAPDTTATEAAGWALCAGTPPTGTTNVLQLRWSESSTTGTTNFAVGYRTQMSGADWQLVRYFCSDSPAALESHVVARHLADQTDPAKRPEVDTSTPRLVTMKLFAFSSEIGDYDYAFRGRMRTPLPTTPGPEVLSIARVGATPTIASSVQWTVTFDGAVTGVNGDDFDLSGISDAAVTGISPVDPPGGATTYTVTASTGTTSGLLSLDLIDDNSIKDATGAPLGGSVLGDGNFSSGETFDVDRNGPSVASITASAPSGASTTPVSWTVTFNEDVTGVSTDGSDFDVVVVSGSTTTSALTVTPVDASTYTVATTPAGVGTIRLDLDDDTTILDLVGNPLGGLGPDNGDFSGEEYSVTASGPSPGPSPSIASLQLVNGGTEGTVDEGDKVVIKFSEAMKLDSFCSGWTGADIAGGDQVTVTLTNSATNDQLSVGTTSTTCGGASFNFGTIQLAENYVSGNGSFKGNGTGGNTPSKISWNAGSNELTITLGKRSGGNVSVANRPTSTPTYAASEFITDADGNKVNPASFTATTGSRF